MHETMPLGRIDMYNSEHHLSKGCWCVHVQFWKITFQRATVVCMHYHIFIMDGGFEPACATLTSFAP